MVKISFEEEKPRKKGKSEYSWVRFKASDLEFIKREFGVTKNSTIADIVLQIAKAKSKEELLKLFEFE